MKFLILFILFLLPSISQAAFNPFPAPSPPASTLNNKGELFGHNGTNQLAIAACANTEMVEWDSTTAHGFKCVANSSVGSKTVVTKTTTATLLVTGEGVVLADAATIGAFTITLPTAVGNKDLEYLIIKSDTGTNHVTVDGNAAETVGGELTRVIFSNGDYIRIVSDNSNWVILDKKNTVFTFVQGNTSGVITANTEDISWNSIQEDTAGVWGNQGNTGGSVAGAGDNDSFTCPVGEAGEYLVVMAIRITSSTTAEIRAYVDGSNRKFLDAFATRVNNGFSGIIRLEPGEVLTFRTDIGFTLNGATNDHHISIKKI